MLVFTLIDSLSYLIYLSQLTITGYENNGYADQQTDFLENENDRMATELSAQVKALKTVST